MVCHGCRGPSGCVCRLGARLRWPASIRLPGGALHPSLRPPLSLGGSDTETIVRFLSLLSQRGKQRPAGSQTATASPGMGGTDWRSPRGQAQGRAGAVRTGQKGHVSQWVLEARCSRAGWRQQTPGAGMTGGNSWGGWGPLLVFLGVTEEGVGCQASGVLAAFTSVTPVPSQL